ncbi:MAG: DUF7544 domain-containing protein [Anaerolineae bacterium]
MKHTDLLKHAYQITVRYRVLWLFGILLALTSGSGGNVPQWRTGGRRGADLPIPGLDRLGLGHVDWQALAPIIVAGCCVLFILTIISIIVNYVARVALYRSVDQIEATASAPTWREGVRLGWSNRTFRLFLLDLIVWLPFAIVALLLLALGAAPLLLLLIDDPVAKALGVAATVGLEIVIIVALIVVGVILGVFGQFWSREIGLADRSIGQALATGYALARRRLKDVTVLWLLLFALGLGYGLVFLVILVVVLILAAAVGGGIGLAIHALTGSVGWAVAVGLPFFLVILLVPTVFIQGLWLVFESTAWTLAYREVASAKG